MPTISWNEVRDRAIHFSRDWTDARNERADAQTFWNEFFEVFGLRRRTVATFEEPVRNLGGNFGRIDLFWCGVVLVEHKSLGEDLGAAASQAFAYLQDLARERRERELPRYIIVSDFARLVLYDLEPDEQLNLPLFAGRRFSCLEFPLVELHRHARAFAFLKGERSVKVDPEDTANIDAADLMAELHDVLEEGGFSGHDLERFLVRILFCLFADDTGIFEPNAFQGYVVNHTAEDGRDLGAQLSRLFDVLNTSPDRRQRALDEDLGAFPYVNGALFAERLGFPAFNADMRNRLLAATRFNWSRISPAVFGSLFQGIMEPRERRQQGAHYTSERDILKVVRSLFLDELQAEFAAIRDDRSTRRTARLEQFQQRLASLRFLDPACGCGNFLVIIYRELRRLELEVLRLLHRGQHEFTLDEVNRLTRVNVDQFFGIELHEWPVRIAEVTLWLMDHQMNLELTEAFGQRYQRLPLRASPTIRQANALRIEWREVLLPGQCSYVLGNPPFVGKHYQTSEQKADLAHALTGFRNVGDLDYVVGWYYLAASYMHRTSVRAGLVATNSITQGEQVALVWPLLFQRFGVRLVFAHRTFVWMSEARGRAHVHVVVIGFATCDDTTPRRIYDYEGDPERPTVLVVPNISPYLTPGSNLVVTKKQQPLGDVPKMRCGSKPSDGGNLVLDRAERRELMDENPAAGRFLRPFVGSEEMINGGERWCLWLVDAPPSELRALHAVMRRVEAVRAFRLASTAAPTRAAAETPTEFFFRSQPATEYLAIPEVSSENRRYIPIGFLPPTIIASNKLYIVPTSSRYLLGVLSSAMHMAWVRQIAGRLKSDFQYSGTMVYNTLPWPEAATDRQRTAVESAAQAVLDARAEHPDATLADLYDPLTMPPNLLRTHAELDRAVDRCYRAEPFRTERERLEFLFVRYEQLTAPIVVAAAPRRRSRRGA